MKLNAQLTYPAPPDRVFAMLLDPAFQARVCRATGALEHTVDVQEDGGSAVITTSRRFPTDDFPSLVKKFVGATVMVTRTDRWGPAETDGARRGSAVVEIGGAPVRFTGALTMVATGEGTVQDFLGELKASVPLVGGKIEHAAEPPIRAAITTEQDVGRSWLAGSS